MNYDLDLAAFGTASAATAALAWVQAIRQDRFESVWAAMTDDFRLVCVQDWIMSNPSVMSAPQVAGTRDELAAELAGVSPTHPLWVYAKRVSERTVRSATTDVVGDRELGSASRPRPIAPDLELIRLIPLDQLDVDEDGVHLWQPGQAVENVTLLLQQSPDGWRVAGAGDRLPRPGWPPDFETVVSPSD